jgi:flagellar motor switch protein FliM
VTLEKEKTLSQKEIDALLSILPSGNDAVAQMGNVVTMPGRFIGSVRTYDFRSPDKFSKEQIRTLQMIHENFARRVSSALAAYLRATVHLACVHIEQGSFADFLQNVPASSIAAVLKADPLPGRILLTLDNATATIAIDRLLGGFGEPLEDHQVTDIEQSLVRGVMQYFADGLQEAWRNVIALNVSLEEITLNPEFVQVALPSDAAIFLGFEIKVRESNGMMSICIPYSVLKPIVSELSPHTWVAGETSEAGKHRKGLLEHLRHTTVDVSVLLGETTVNFEDLLHLQEGDVLVLNTLVNRALPVKVGKEKRYLGHPGLSGSHMAVQITEIMEDM